MLLECDSCPAPIHHCAGCVVNALLGEPLPVPARGSVPEVPLDRGERRAVEMFVAAGLVASGELTRCRARVTSREGVPSLPGRTA